MRDEATYALERNKLVPVALENVDLSFRFKGVHTLRLLNWDGSDDAMEFRKLVEDIAVVIENDQTHPLAQDWYYTATRGHICARCRKSGPSIDPG